MVSIRLIRKKLKTELATLHFDQASCVASPARPVMNSPGYPTAPHQWAFNENWLEPVWFNSPEHSCPGGLRLNVNLVAESVGWLED